MFLTDTVPALSECCASRGRQHVFPRSMGGARTQSVSTHWRGGSRAPRRPAPRYFPGGRMEFPAQALVV